MTSDRHGAGVGRGRAGHGWPVALGLLLGLGAGGCFGDWVSARPRPRGSEAESSTTPKLDAGAPPTDACAAYVAAVAERCHAVLDGHLGHCHRELVRVMTLWQPEPVDHRPRPNASPSPAEAPGSEPVKQGLGSPADRRAGPQVCAQLSSTLAEVEPPRRTAGAQLGPACREWAEAVRERCVAPLSSMPPDLRRCGPDLLAFEGILGAATFGRPLDYEPQCRDAVERLKVGPAAPSGADPAGAARAGRAG